ncbi:uncharacterized protein LOC119672267 [Teleopsis dalmanni]|uniref:uncharacterized protein LOC119672267 n=1 Tax=Teleopsis dalmanni TaxID=139649 RepID=UPI0018CE3B92|nr:uncharacterized protein LOC119672267 [Teleopsis dalmanni]
MWHHTFIRYYTQKRIPLIKFRKGSSGTAATAAPNTAVAGAAGAAPAGPPAAGGAPQNAPAASSNAIEDYDLPERYKRKPLTDYEIEYINQGGPP